MMYAGVDPGLSGAIALWRPNHPDGGLLTVHDMPTLRVKPGSQKRTLDAVELARLIDAEIGHINTFAVIEMAGARPNEGLGSAHANGRNWGVAYGILVAQFITVEIVQPAAWKRAMGCPSAKDGAIARAKQLLPKHAHNFTLAKHHGRAESSLLALYAERRFRSQAVTP